MWSLCSVCSCPFLFYRIPFWTRSYRTAPRTCFVCPSPSSTHTFLLSAVLEGILSLPNSVSLCAEYSRILSRVAVECVTQEEQLNPMSVIQLADLSLRFFPFMIIYLFIIYFLSPLPPDPTSCSGYAVTAGHFSQRTTTDVVGGAPQDGGIGKVWLFVKK